jgi:hypothetical protein
MPNVRFPPIADSNHLGDAARVSDKHEPQPIPMNGFVFFGVFFPAIAVLAYLFIVFRTVDHSDRYADIQPFAGCYFAANADVVVLGSEGRVSAGAGPVGTYSILRPVPGKHGYLLELDATGFAEVNGRLVLDPQGRAKLLDISPAGVVSVHAGEGETKFRKGECPDAQA